MDHDRFITLAQRAGFSLYLGEKENCDELTFNFLERAFITNLSNFAKLAEEDMKTQITAANSLKKT